MTETESDEQRPEEWWTLAPEALQCRQNDYEAIGQHTMNLASCRRRERDFAAAEALLSRARSLRRDPTR